MDLGDAPTRTERVRRVEQCANRTWHDPVRRRTFAARVCDTREGQTLCVVLPEPVCPVRKDCRVVAARTLLRALFDVRVDFVLRRLLAEHGIKTTANFVARLGRRRQDSSFRPNRCDDARLPAPSASKAKSGRMRTRTLMFSLRPSSPSTSSSSSRAVQARRRRNEHRNALRVIRSIEASLLG